MIDLTVSDAIDLFELKVVAGASHIDNKISSVHIGDLLSFVMDKAEAGCAWITIHGQLNIVAVAVLANISCIIVSENVKVADDTIKRAELEGVPILTTSRTTFDMVKEFVLYERAHP